MPSPELATDTRVVIKRQFNAAPEQVFSAWTTAQALERWFAPSADMTTRVVALDAQEGGNYRFQMIEAGGKTYTVFGTFHVVDPPQRLVFSWGWEPLPGETPLDYSQSRVTVELVEARGGTELTLIHERLPDAEMQREHEHGWQGCLDRLAEAI